MRNILLSILAFVLVAGCQSNTSSGRMDGHAGTAGAADTTDATNDFYDNAPARSLEHNGQVQVQGEVEHPRKITFEGLPLRSVIVKETVLDGGETEFVGAYRYEGYSLYDLLNHVDVDKANKEDFAPIIDLYVTVSNAEGEKVVLSWGEIYYPVNRHQVLIATRVTPILPSKTREHWPLPEDSRLVVGTDLVTGRNMARPTRISVHSLDADFPVKGDLDSLYAPSVKVFHHGDSITTLHEPAGDHDLYSYPNTFYGRGRGIHGISRFDGYRLKDLLPGRDSLSTEYIRWGMYTIAAPDGYRAAFSYSEIMNRNDQSEALLMDRGAGRADGRWRLFMAADFFSDRAIKAVSQIHLDKK